MADSRAEWSVALATRALARLARVKGCSAGRPPVVMARVAMWERACQCSRAYRENRNCQGYQDSLVATPFPIGDLVTGEVDTEATGLPDNQTTRKAPFGTIVHSSRSVSRSAADTAVY